MSLDSLQVWPVSGTLATPSNVQVLLTHQGYLPVYKGNFHSLPNIAQQVIAQWAHQCKPRGLYICDGSEKEAEIIENKLLNRQAIQEEDAVRDFEKVGLFAVRTQNMKIMSMSTQSAGKTTNLWDGNSIQVDYWADPEEMDTCMKKCFKNCMTGRLLYVIPFSLGPLDSPLSKFGMKLTDSAMDVLNMRSSTRVSKMIWKRMRGEKQRKNIIRWISSEKNKHQIDSALLAYVSDENLVATFAECQLSTAAVLLRLCSRMSRDEGWLAENMCIIGVTAPDGVETFMAVGVAAGCEKTSFLDIRPSLEGWSITIISREAAFMKFDDNGQLLAVNPLNEFNPLICQYYGGDPDDIHDQWDHRDGVPISAIVFGCRRPESVPLVMEARDWLHGVLLGAQVKDEDDDGSITHNPMAMRPYLGLNIHDYLQHWIDLGKEKKEETLPKIFHINWHRQNTEDEVVWPGEGENIRVLEWICDRVNRAGVTEAEDTPIGLLPTPQSINFDDLHVNWEELFSITPNFWLDDLNISRDFLLQQTDSHIPQELEEEFKKLENSLLSVSNDDDN